MFSVVPFFCVSQDSDFSKYNTQIRDVKKEVTYFEIEKINNQFYMLVGGGGNVGVFISDQNVVLIDNKYEIIEDILMTSLKK